MKKIKVYAIFCNNNYTGYTTDKKVARAILEERNFDREIVWKFHRLKLTEEELKNVNEYDREYEYFFDDFMMLRYVTNDELNNFIAEFDAYMLNLEHKFVSGLSGAFNFLKDEDIKDRYFETLNTLYALVELVIYKEDTGEKFINMTEKAEERFFQYEDGMPINSSELWEDFINNYVYPF